MVAAVSLNCSLGTTEDQLEEYPAGDSGLTVKLDFDEGTGQEHTALFKFSK